jgi:hypothetical protein
VEGQPDVTVGGHGRKCLVSDHSEIKGTVTQPLNPLNIKEKTSRSSYSDFKGQSSTLKT